MKIRELKHIINALDDNVEVQICNHHLEDTAIVQAQVVVKNPKKDAYIVLRLHERKL